MASYKVPQDVEAEDKFLGPLTFKQFLFAGGAIVSGYVLFIFLSRGVWPLAFVVLPFFIFFAALAFPWSKDQPTELWLASRIRFFIVPRKRIWNQSGMKDLVEITVPKREQKFYTDGLNQDQVQNRLSALATVVDTRGWAVKNASYTAPEESDRLVSAAAPTNQEAEKIVQTATDVMDEKSNPIAQQFETLIEKSEAKHKEETLSMIAEARRSSEKAKMQTEEDATGKALTPIEKQKALGAKGGKKQDFWFMEQPELPADPNLARFQNSSVVAPGQKQTPPVSAPVSPSIDAKTEQEVLNKVHAHQAQDALLKGQSHLKTIKPLSEQAEDEAKNIKKPIINQQGLGTGATPVNPAIMNLSKNDDLNLETLSRQAKRDMPDEGEVVISLHNR